MENDSHGVAWLPAVAPLYLADEVAGRIPQDLGVLRVGGFARES